MTWKDLLSERTIRQLCDQYGLRPSKEYGQNYLHAAGPIERMLEAGQVTKDTTVVEVGPGFGVLTLAAVERVKKVVSFEIEQTLRAYWDDRVVEYPNIHIIWGNAMTQFAKHLPSDPYVVLANVPYQITSQLTRLFLESHPAPQRVVMMVQKEVAERICAKPGDMSLLSVSVQLYGKPRAVTTVKKGNFWPVPKVDSAVLLIDDISHPPAAEQIMKLAKAGFAQKRKQLWRNLMQGLSLEKEVVLQALQDSQLSQTIRAQELSIANWQELAHHLTEHTK